MGYLRIAADKHYLSDVTVGAVLGTLIGAGIPLLFHHASSAESQTAMSSTPQALGRQQRSPFNFTARRW